jgi:peptidoglycan/LPS O-acetylase OafA/YrhL
MNRTRALKVVLVLVGLLFVAAVLPVASGIMHPEQSDTGDTMMMSLYATLGVFLLLASRNPSAQRTLIAFAAWSSFAHAVVMSLLALKIPTDRDGFLISSVVLVIIGVVLLALAPAKPEVPSAVALPSEPA